MDLIKDIRESHDYGINFTGIDFDLLRKAETYLPENYIRDMILGLEYHRGILLDELEAAKMKLGVINKLPRYTPSHSETWMNAYAVKFEKSEHGAWIDARKVKVILEKNDERS